ncbi:MAG: hypothetical protein R6W70_08660 [bacterium]
MTLDNYRGNRNTIMDKRGEGVPIILSESEKLSGKCLIAQWQRTIFSMSV